MQSTSTINQKKMFDEKFNEVEQKKRQQIRNLIKKLYEVSEFKIFHDTTVDEIKKHHDFVIEVCNQVNDAKKIVDAYRIALELKYELEKNEPVC